MTTTNTRCPRCNARLPRQAQFIQPSYGTEPLVAVIMTTAGFGALLFAFVHKWWPPDWWLFDLRQVDNVRLVAVSSVYGLGLALEGTFVAVMYHYMERYGIIEPVEYEEPEPTGPEFAAVDRYTLRRLPDGVTEHRLWQYLVAIAAGRVTLSQDGAAEHGFDRDQSNEIKEWLIAVNWWKWISESNATGRFTDEGQAVLAMLARNPPALWDEVVARPTQGEVYS